MQTVKKKRAMNLTKKIQLVLAVFLLFAAVLLLCESCEKKDQGSEAFLNKIVEMSDEEKQAAIDKVVEEGMINIQYQKNAVFHGDQAVSFNVKNIANNHHPLKFTIVDEDERILYESQEIPPGYEMKEIVLEKSLPKGVHECRMMIGYATEGAVVSSFPITIEVK